MTDAPSRSFVSTGRVLAGRYRCDALLGRGGMGEVWRCHDLEQARDVAVKVVHPAVTAEPWAGRLLQGEVTAMARLAHAAIVPVYDFLSEPGLGSLLVMELRAGAVPLRALIQRPPTWPALRDLFDVLLAALAYAHAKGVLHLDVKPENVLVEPLPGGAWRPTLLDFGISRVRRAGRGVEPWSEQGDVMGTVAYMAPEQVSGDVGSLGPWTDLYAMGTMLFELLAGHLPFGGLDPAAAMVERLTAAAPPLRLRCALGAPLAVAGLVARLLAGEPHQRPRLAADVRAALRALGAGDDAPATAGSEPETGRGLHDSPDTFALARTVAAVDAAVDEDAVLETATLPAAVRPGVTTPPPPSPARPVAQPDGEPEPWTAPALYPELPLAPSSGDPAPGSYGLYGLRDLPLLGRIEERRLGWQAVREAAEARRPRVILFEGRAGAGKSRLARDLAEHGEQLGLFERQTTWWTEAQRADEGLRGLVENALDARGLDDGAVAARLAFWLAGVPGRHDAFAREVRLLLRPPPGATPDSGLPIRVAVELIERAATRRPILLWLDDLQWAGREALPFLERLLDHPGPLAVCVVATRRTDDPEPDWHPALLGRPDVRSVQLPALPAGDVRRLLRGLLDVDDGLADFIAGRSEGNPLFATLLLHQLVEAGALDRSSGRYRLAGAFDVERVPSDIDALWQARVARVLACEAERAALRLLAITGERLGADRVDALEAALPEEARASLRTAIGAARSAGLLRDESGLLAWEHGLLREHLVLGLTGPACTAAHRLVATALASLEAAGQEVEHERARHLMLAGDVGAACEPMLRAAHRAFDRGLFDQALAWSAEVREWLTAGGERPELDRFLAKSLSISAEALLEHARVEEAAALVAAAVEAAKRSVDLEATLWAARVRGVLLRRQGRLLDALALHDEEAGTARAEGLDRVLGAAQFSRAQMLTRLGRFAEAEVAIDEALAIARRTGERGRLPHCLWQHASLLLAQERLAEAVPVLDEALALAQSTGNLRMEALLTNDLTELETARGRVAEARAAGERFLAQAQRMGNRYYTAYARINLALLAFTAGDPDEAAEQLVRLEAAGIPNEQMARVAHLYARAELAVWRGADEDEASRRLTEAAAARREQGVLHHDFARSAERAAARAAEEPRRAFLRDAAEIYSRLGRDADAARVAAKLREANGVVTPDESPRPERRRAGPAAGGGCA